MLTNYEFGFTKETKRIEAEKSWGLDALQICYEFEAEKRWVSTNYRFGFTKEIKRNEAEKSWGLDKLWI